MGAQSYCDVINEMKDAGVHKDYHDNEYGYPLHDDNELFGRLVLEINQAGLSWTTILKKKDNFLKAYDNFNVKKVASYSQRDIDRLLSDAGIIRNRLKINAAVHNAQQVIKIQDEHGSFREWLNMHHPLVRDEWVKLFKKTFKFTGSEITNEFLLSTGYLGGAHDESCPIYNKILELNPMWSVHR